MLPGAGCDRQVIKGQFSWARPGQAGFGARGDNFIMRGTAALLVASTGGHLDELARLRSRIQPLPTDVTWATFDTEHSRSLLAGQRVRHVTYVRPRGYFAAIRVLPQALRILLQEKPSVLVSTGAGVAIPFLFWARVLGIPCHYIESAARSQGPSATGKVAMRLPGVRLYTQYEAWADEKWAYVGSLFDAYTLGDDEVAAPKPETGRRPDSVVVTLGTQSHYPFTRAVTAIAKVLPALSGAAADVLWQVGSADTTALDIKAEDSLPAETMRRRIADADLVVAHAGVGSVLSAWDSGHCPVLLPRRASHREHVDDHQLLIARELDRRGLAVSRDPDDLRVEDLALARHRRVVAVAHPRPFALSA